MTPYAHTGNATVLGVITLVLMIATALGRRDKGKQAA
jgi:hypothetical protein